MKKKKTPAKSKKKPVKPAKKKVLKTGKSSAEKKNKVVAKAKKKVLKQAKKKTVAAKPKAKPVAKKAVKPAKKVAAVKPVKALAAKPKKVAVEKPKKTEAAPVKVKPPLSAKKLAAIKAAYLAKKYAVEVKPDPVIPGWTKVQFEYFTRSSVGVLYNAFSTASGLSGWFADYVDSQENLFSFTWDGSEEKAYMIEAVENEYARYRWFAQPEGAFFEFRIRIDGITNEVALVITDYVEKGEEQESQLLWNSIVHELMHILGS